MLNDWISCNDELCADNYNYFQFKLKGKGRSAGCAVHVFSDIPVVMQRQIPMVQPPSCNT